VKFRSEDLQHYPIALAAIPQNWAVASVAEISTGIQPGFPSGKHNQEGRGVPHLRPMNISRHGSIDLSNLRYVEATNGPRLTHGDVLFNNTNSPALIGKTAAVTSPTDWAFSNHMTRIVPAAGIEYRYLAHHLQYLWMSGFFRHRCVNHVNQASISSGPLGSTVPLAIPPPAEQKRIVAAIEEQFSRLDAGVAALERVRQNLKRMRAAVLQATVAAADVHASKRVRIGDILREPLRNGHSAKENRTGTIPILTLTAVTLGDFSQRNIKTTAADPKRVRDLWLKTGDLLIERSNTRELVGTTRLYRGPDNLAVYPDLVIRARVDDSVIPRYVELILQAPEGRQYFQRRAQGISGSMPKIDQAAIEDFTLPHPSVEAQGRIIEVAEQQITMIQLLQSAVDVAEKRSSSLRSSILAAAFSGKLVPQDPSDEPASVLLERIAAEPESTKRRKA